MQTQNEHTIPKRLLTRVAAALRTNPTIAVIPSGNGMYAWVIENEVGQTLKSHKQA